MRLTTDRLILRDYVDADLDAFLAYQAEPEAREFYGPDEAGSDDLRDVLRLFRAWAHEQPRRHYQLAIAARDEPEVTIGSCGLRRLECETSRVDFGLELAPHRWGRGYATEAATAMLDFGFGALGLTAVRGVTVSANARIAMLLRRLGFRELGARVGPGWMAERGWHEVEWELHRDAWRAPRHGRAHAQRP